MAIALGPTLTAAVKAVKIVIVGGKCGRADIFGGAWRGKQLDPRICRFRWQIAEQLRNMPRTNI